MRDVLGTIQADQDAIIRAGSRGALVVDGGPGTGKTVVALHRTAYLLYSDPRLGHRRGGVLFVGPHQPYLAYVGDVLPSLGEEGVQTCTLRDLVPEGATAAVEQDPDVARLKSAPPWCRRSRRRCGSTRSRRVRAPSSRPTGPTSRLSADDWAEAFARRDPGTAHNEARDQVWEELLTIVVDKHGDEDVPADQVRRVAAARRGAGRARSTARGRCSRPPTSSATCGRCRRTCAGARRGSTATEVRALQRDDPQAWTVSDLPLLDAARQRLGDPEAARRQRRQRRVPRRSARADGRRRRRT